MTLWQTDIDPTGLPLRILEWDSVPVQPGSVNTLVTQFGEQSPPLFIDIDGDGVVDREMPVTNQFPGGVGPMLLADLNGDGRVDDGDDAIVQASFGATREEETYNPVADVNRDGIVDDRDLAWVREVIKSEPTFDAFNVEQLKIKFGQRVNDDKSGNNDRFKMKALFTLGAGSDGILPDTEPVGLQLGTFSTTIPSGWFQAERGRFGFKGVIDGVALKAVIRPLENGHFEFTVRGHHANLMGTVNPVEVSLAIGDDSGDTTVMAEFENDEVHKID